MRDVPRRGAFVLGVAALLVACGGGGGGGGGGGAPLPPLPTVDVVVRGVGSSGPAIHLYRDALAAPDVHAPDVRVSPPASIEFVGFTGTHLVLAADLGVASQNRIWVYTPADLAAMPPVPSVQCLLPPPPGATGVTIRGFALFDDDVYVYSVYDDGMSPTTLTYVTHVFRDVTTLPGAAPPDAVVTHGTLTTSLITGANDSLSVDANALVVTGLAKVWVNHAPASLSGAEVPDLTLGLVADLSASAFSLATLGGGDVYIYRPGFEVDGYGPVVDLSAGDTPQFVLQGASQVTPVPNAIVRLGSRLFVRGPFNVAPIAIVGFEVGGTVTDFSPPDVALGAPVVGNHWIDGAADALFAASSATGLVAGYARASLLADGSVPSVYLYDPEIASASEVHVVER